MTSLGRCDVYHNLIMTPVKASEDNSVYQNLCVSEEGEECDYSALQYGYDFVIAYLWLKMKRNSISTDMQSLAAKEDVQSRHSLGTLSAMLIKRFKQDCVYCKDVDHPYIIGGNVVLPVGMTISPKYLAMAYDMLYYPKESKLLRFLKSISKNIDKQPGSINRIVYNKPTESKSHKNRSNLAELIDLIDFPIPSIFVLLQTLGFGYFPVNPYLSAENIYNKPQAIIGGIAVNTTDNTLLRFDYTSAGSELPFDKYKLCTAKQLYDMIADSSAWEPVHERDAQRLGIITNDIIVR